MFFLFVFPAGATAAEAPVKFDPVHVDLSDKASLQRGARIFVNYCLSCHSAAYMRYERMGRDLGINAELLKDNLMFTTDKAGELMTVTMSADVGKKAFGSAPPDLTVVSRSRGPAWIYNYMRGFYRDPKSATGWNNIVFPDVAMPHVLYSLQGQQRAVFEAKENGVKKFKGFELKHPGTMNADEYDGAMRDLTNFFVYMGEPAKLVRYRIGVYVLVFLGVFLVFIYLLKRDYWKDVH